MTSIVKYFFLIPDDWVFIVDVDFNLYLFCVMVLQARIAKDLVELRNKSVFAFFMFNALFILIVFLLQLNKDNLHVDWPFGVKTNITHNEETGEVVFLHCQNSCVWYALYPLTVWDYM